MNKKEVIAVIEENVQRHGPYDLEFDIPDFKIKEIETKGGEGKGEHHHIVFQVSSKKYDTFFVKADGYYSSYEGTEYGDAHVYEVESYIKEVKDWRKVK